jgi:hypothetical protein
MQKIFYPHQKNIFHYTMRQPHPALFVEMRLGKTLVTLRRCSLYAPRQCKLGLRILVVAPNSALGGWEDDGTADGWDIAWLVGSKKKRQQILDSCFIPKKPSRMLCLINKEAWSVVPSIGQLPWDAVIADESTFLKNPTAKVTKFFIKHFRDVPHRWILTGTPCPEGEHEYFCQLAFARGGAFGFRKFWDFRMHYMRPHPAGFGWILKPGAPDHIRRTVGSTCCVLRRKDVKLDSHKIYERRELTLPPSLRKIYNKAETEFLMAKGDLSASTKWVTVVWQWLRQLCGGFIQKELVWSAKIKELLSLLLGELKRDQVVVWCCYNAEIAAIMSSLKTKHITCDGWTGATKPTQRHEIRKRFQAGKMRVLVLQQATAKTGMDLSAADTAIYYSSPPGQEARLQTEDRILSLKKKQSLLYIDLVVKDTVEEDTLAELKKKIALSDLSLSRALLASMRKRQENKRRKQ